MSYFNNIYLIKFCQVPDIQQLSGRQTLLRYEIYFRSTRPIYGHLQGGTEYFSSDTVYLG